LIFEKAQKADFSSVSFVKISMSLYKQGVGETHPKFLIPHS